jgi:hypothetical protein
MSNARAPFAMMAGNPNYENPYVIVARGYNADDVQLTIAHQPTKCR